MSGSSFLHDALPFIFAVIYVLLSPAIDYVVWRRRYREFYASEELGAVTAADLVNGAQWAVNLGQAVPAMLLTAAGILLAVESLSPEVAGGALVAGALPFCLAAWLQHRANLHQPKRDPHVWVYSLPQLVVIAVNVGAVVVLAVEA